MATTATYSGSLSIAATLSALFGGDSAGGRTASIADAIAFAAAGGTAPTLSGFFKGTAIAAAGDWLLAHGSDPLQGMGDAAYSDGFTVASSKLKLLYVKNTDATNSITIARKAATGLPIFDTAGDSITLAPGDIFLYYKQAGTAALATGTNDGLTISVSGGSPTCTVVACYGP